MNDQLDRLVTYIETEYANSVEAVKDIDEAIWKAHPSQRPELEHTRDHRTVKRDTLFNVVQVARRARASR